MAARELTNGLAPEHLTVDLGRGFEVGQECGSSVFVGDYSPQSMGDYISGPDRHNASQPGVGQCARGA